MIRVTLLFLATATRRMDAGSFVASVNARERQLRAQSHSLSSYSAAAGEAAGRFRDALDQNPSLIVGSRAWVVLHVALHRALLNEALYSEGATSKHGSTLVARRKFIVISFGGTASTALVRFLRHFGDAFHLHEPRPPPGGRLRELISAASDCRTPNERAMGRRPWFCFVTRFGFGVQGTLN